MSLEKAKGLRHLPHEKSVGLYVDHSALLQGVSYSNRIQPYACHLHAIQCGRGTCTIHWKKLTA